MEGKENMILEQLPPIGKTLQPPIEPTVQVSDTTNVPWQPYSW